MNPEEAKHDKLLEAGGISKKLSRSSSADQQNPAETTARNEGIRADGKGMSKRKTGNRSCCSMDWVRSIVSTNKQRL